MKATDEYRCDKQSDGTYHFMVKYISEDGMIEDWRHVPELDDTCGDNVVIIPNRKLLAVDWNWDNRGDLDNMIFSSNSDKMLIDIVHKLYDNTTKSVPVNENEYKHHIVGYGYDHFDGIARVKLVEKDKCTDDIIGTNLTTEDISETTKHFYAEYEDERDINKIYSDDKIFKTIGFCGETYYYSGDYRDSGTEQVCIDLSTIDWDKLDTDYIDINFISRFYILNDNDGLAMNMPRLDDEPVFSEYYLQSKLEKKVSALLVDQIKKANPDGIPYYRDPLNCLENWVRAGVKLYKSLSYKYTFNFYVYDNDVQLYPTYIKYKSKTFDYYRYLNYKGTKAYEKHQTIHSYKFNIESPVLLNLFQPGIMYECSNNLSRAAIRAGVSINMFKDLGEGDRLLINQGHRKEYTDAARPIFCLNSGSPFYLNVFEWTLNYIMPDTSDLNETDIDNLTYSDLQKMCKMYCFDEENHYTDLDDINDIKNNISLILRVYKNYNFIVLKDFDNSISDNEITKPVDIKYGCVKSGRCKPNTYYKFDVSDIYPLTDNSFKIDVNSTESEIGSRPDTTPTWRLVSSESAGSEPCTPKEGCKNCKILISKQTYQDLNRCSATYGQKRTELERKRYDTNCGDSGGGEPAEPDPEKP